PQRVHSDTALVNVRTKSKAFDFGRNMGGIETSVDQRLYHIQKQSLLYNVSGRMCSIHIGNIDCAIEVNLEKLLDDWYITVAASGAITFVYKKLVIVQCGDFTHA